MLVETNVGQSREDRSRNLCLAETLRPLAVILESQAAQSRPGDPSQGPDLEHAKGVPRAMDLKAGTSEPPGPWSRKHQLSQPAPSSGLWQ